jgi:hypothetical protein
MRSPLVILVVSFAVLWVASRIGSRLRAIMVGVPEDFGLILTSTLTLLGLIVGFTFSMAVNRYDQRKLYEAEEANAIGTEYERTGFLPSQRCEAVRKLLRQYLDHRILVYEQSSNVVIERTDPVTARLQEQMWNEVRDAAIPQPTPVMALVVSGMNDVLNSQAYSLASWRNRIPVMAWALLGLIAICGQIMVGGYLHKARATGILMLVLPAILSISFFLIADLDAQAGGLIRVRPLNLETVAESIGP